MRRRDLVEILFSFGSQLGFMAFMVGVAFAGSLLLNQTLAFAAGAALATIGFFVGMAPLIWLRYDRSDEEEAADRRGPGRLLVLFALAVLWAAAVFAATYGLLALAGWDDTEVR